MGEILEGGIPLPHLKRSLSCPFPLSQCHGLWDEDDVTDSGLDKEESDDELSLSHRRRASSDSLKSINLAASAESVHVSFPEQPAAVRRKRSASSSQISQRSSFSSNRSKRGTIMWSLGWNNPPHCLLLLVPVSLSRGVCWVLQRERDCDVKKRALKSNRPNFKSWLSCACDLAQSHHCSKCLIPPQDEDFRQL